MSSLPTEQEVFQCLCKVYGSSAAFSEIATRTDLFPHGSKSAETWLRKTTKGSILVTEDKKGKITKVHAFSANARLCLDYSYNGKCDNHDCTYLHICGDYMTNSCSRGVTCQLNHHFHNQRDRALLSKINFDQFTDLQLQMLVLSSTPQICVKYNTDGKCKRADYCTNIHICHGYLRKCCTGYKCGLLHETAMDTDHTKAVLKRLMFNNVDKHEVMKMILDNELNLLSDSCDKTMLNDNVNSHEEVEMILDNKLSLLPDSCDKTMLNDNVDNHEVVEIILDDEPSLSENITTECHTHPDKPDAYICPQFLIGRCDKGLACTELHCSLPYHWQYKVSLFDEWECFTNKDNLALEKLYCDVNVGMLVNFKPAGSFDLSRLQRQGRLPCDLEYEITIDLDNMTIAFQRPRGGEGLLAGLLRRLSTVSCVTWRHQSMFTNWKWYWKDNGNVWHAYDKDYSESDLQKQIEQAYQDMLRQGKTIATYQFLTSENVYKLFFDSTREMYQVNVRTGTKRQVKRRPEKPISDDDLNEWDRGDSTSRRKIEERPVKTYIPSHVPSHWSSMPLNVPYTRVALDAASTEFQDVEKLFNQSMDGRVVIENIDRIQNPLIWEEYCRNKEKMMRKAHLLNQQQVDERNLFHGTSPENVETICEDNFDPGIHKKNKRLRLGQGTYFAVNAVVSHKYAKRDSDLFRYMFLAKVLVGSYTKGHCSYQRPPPKYFSYDSCVDNVSNPSIFVVFDRDHFYPEYVIKYLSDQPLSSGRLHVHLQNRLVQRLTPSSSTQSSLSVSAVSSSSGFASESPSWFAAVAKANSAHCGSLQLRPTSPEMPMAPRSEHGILKCQSSSSNYLGKASLMSGSTAQSSYSASTVSNAERSGTSATSGSDNPDATPLPSGSTTQSSYSASTVSSAELTGKAVTKSSVNLDTASLPSGSTAQSSYSASNCV